MRGPTAFKQWIWLVEEDWIDHGEAAYRMLDEIADCAEAAEAICRWQISCGLRRKTCEKQQRPCSGSGCPTGLQARYPMPRAFARVLGAHYHLKAAAIGGADSVQGKLASVYIRRLLPEHLAALREAREGAAGLYALSADDLS